MSELRKDPILGRWVIFAAARSKRPSDFTSHPQLPPQPGPCAFCPNQEHETGDEVLAFRDSGAEGAPDWRVRVVKNKFPAVTMDSQLHSPIDEGSFSACCMPAFGSHEVVIETPDHDTPFACLPVSNVVEVLKAFCCRIRQCRQDERFKYVQVFKNHGNAAGASMRHSHSQIIALPILTRNVHDEIDGAKKHYDRTGKCVLCEVIDHDILDRKRLIEESPDFVVIAPYAPRFPYETWLVPRWHSSNYEDITDSQLWSLANILLSTLRKMDHIFHNPPYNYMLQTAPLQEHSNVSYFHWYIRVVPHLIKLGGFELGSGCHINPVLPEAAATALREAEITNSNASHEITGH